MVIKMKDLIKGQTDMLREKFVHRRLHEADPPPAGGGEDKPPEPQKLKIDIPDSPFEPDVNQIKDRLKQILKNWQKFGKANPNDIVTLIKYLDGEK
jgi:hypothetical protein